MPPERTAHDAIRRTIHFSGRVQGVGFRFATHAIAADYTVTGFVRNLPDGRVQLVVEGTPHAVASFQHAVTTAMRGYIDHTTFSDRPATHDFETFAIAM
ncbi:MAG: acylphosphatase [Phycisphaerae bacterium]